MKFVAPRSGRLSDLLRQLGVDAPQNAAKLVAERNGLKSEHTTKGAVLQIPDSLIRTQGPPDQSALVATTQKGAAPMKSLGLHAIQTLLDAAEGSSPPKALGQLAALAALKLPELSADAIEGGSLQLDLPLKPGRHILPLGNGERLEVQVASGTALRADLSLSPDGTLSASSMKLTPPLGIVNHAKLSIFAQLPMGGIATSIAGAMFKLSLGEVDIQEDGAMSMKVSMDRPSLNPLKVLVGQSAKDTFTIPSAMLPRVQMDAKSLLAGRITEERSLLAPGMPSAINPGQLLSAFGTMSGEGRFALSLFGKHGVVDVGEPGLRVRGASGVVATVNGDFEIDSQGKIQTRFEARTNTKNQEMHLAGEAELRHQNGALTGALKTSGHGKVPIPLDAPIQVILSDAKTGAKVGPLEVSHDDQMMKVRSGRRWFGIMDSLERKLLMSVGDHVSMSGEAGIMFSADMAFSLGSAGLKLQSKGVDVTFDLEGTQVKGEALDVQLGEGSSFSLSIDDLEYDQNGLRLRDMEGGLEVHIAKGRLDAGALSALLDGKKDNALTGQLALSKDEGASLNADVSFSIHAIPKLAGIGAGIKAKSAGKTGVKITRDGLQLTVGARKVSPYL